MATDLRLVVDAAERDAATNVPATHRAGDGLAETRLADPWRADEGDDRAVAPPAVALAEPSSPRSRRSLRVARNSTMRSLTSASP